MTDSLETLVGKLKKELEDTQAQVAGAKQSLTALRSIERDLRNELARLQSEVAILRPQYETMLRGIEGFHTWIARSAGGN
jgi:chromosome segregation ATPase